MHSIVQKQKHFMTQLDGEITFTGSNAELFQGLNKLVEGGWGGGGGWNFSLKITRF